MLANCCNLRENLLTSLARCQPIGTKIAFGVPRRRAPTPNDRLALSRVRLIIELGVIHVDIRHILLA